MSYGLDKFLGDLDPNEDLSFQYVSIKLITGETVFASLAELDDNNYCVMLPLKVTQMLVNQKYMSALTEYNVGTDDIFSVLPKDRCVLINILSDDSIVEYNKAVKKLMAAITTLTEEDKEEISGNVVSIKDRLLH